MAHLIFLRGNQRDRRVAIERFPCSLGRGDDNDIVVEDLRISDHHLRIKKRGQLYILEDRGSSNGTYVNGEKTLNSIIQNGDRIIVGETEILFALPPAIRLATGLFNAIAASPIPVEIAPEDTAASPDEQMIKRRFDQDAIINASITSSTGLRRIFDYQSNLLLCQTLSEVAQATLRSLSELAPSSRYVAALIRSPHDQDLVPFASSARGELGPLVIERSDLSRVLTRKQGYLLTRGDSTQVLVPILRRQKLIAIFYLDTEAKSIPDAELRLIQAFAARSAPFFENALLRLEVESFSMGMIETVVAAIEAKDTYTVGHSERVCRYAMAIADQLRLNRETKKLLMMSALCHDIGKIGIPDAILKKASLLSSEEYAEMKLHPIIGADIVSHLPHAKKFVSGIKYHHEKWDGTGYPEGLMGEEIPFFGRIIAVADVFDAMVSGRSYSGFVDESDAIEKIQKEIELFDPDIIRALVGAWEAGAITQKTSTIK